MNCKTISAGPSRDGTKANDMVPDPSWLLSWSGSEICQASLTEQGKLHIAFSVVSVKNTEGVEGYLTHVACTLTPLGAPSCLSADGSPLALSDLLGGISTGHLHIDSLAQHRQQLPIPMACDGAVSLSWRLISGCSLEARGTQLFVTLDDHSQFRESMNC